MSSALLCTVPVDRVFGVLGILQRYDAPERRFLKVDYSAPLEEVLELACRTSITVLRGSLYPLALVSHTRMFAESEKKKPALPSWVPDWTTHPLSVAELGTSFDACDGSLRSAELGGPTQSTQGVLIVSGMVAGHVSTLGPIITLDMVSEEGKLIGLANLLEEWINQEFNTSGERTAAFDCLPALLTAAAYPDTVSEHGTWKHSWIGFRELLVDIASDPLHSKLSGRNNATSSQQGIVNLHPNILDTCTNRRLCITSTGMVGIGPWLLSKGDIVTVLDGLSWPAFLRAGQQANHSYQFLGVGYLHSVMDGTWARQQRLMGCKSRLFSLK